MVMKPTEQSNRYVRIRCPLCDEVSPTVDQQEDVHRAAMSEWWHRHRLTHPPFPIIERVEV